MEEQNEKNEHKQRRISEFPIRNLMWESIKLTSSFRNGINYISFERRCIAMENEHKELREKTKEEMESDVLEAVLVNKVEKE